MASGASPPAYFFLSPGLARDPPPQVYQSDDLVNWRNVSDLPDFGWETSAQHDGKSRWATDAAEKDGQYYWYVSVDGNTVSVVTGPTPAGPWRDPLGYSMLNETLGKSLDPPTSIRDPGTLKDDDGSHYLVYGACSGPSQPDDCCYYASKLNDDMVSGAAPVHLSVKNATGNYGPGKCDDKPFLHKRRGTYYLSWGAFYATATSVYGPYEYRGSVIDPAALSADFRMPNVSKPESFAGADYRDRHGSFAEIHGQWYFFTNDRSHSDAPHWSPPAWAGGFRDTVAGYVYYNEDGTIAPVAIDAKGVAAHDVAADGPLPAAEFFKLAGPGGVVAGGSDAANAFVVALHAASRLTFSGLTNVATPSQLRAPSLRVAGACVATLTFTVASSGESLASCRVDVKIRDSFKDVPCALNDVYVPEVAALDLAVATDEDCDLLLDTITFTAA